MILKFYSKNVCEPVKPLAVFLQCNVGVYEEAKGSYVVSSFIVCSNRSRSALVGVLFLYNSLFVR